MSQQGDRRRRTSGQEDDWWGQLYDDFTEDTGPSPAPDTLDDRFASASDTVAPPGGPLAPQGAAASAPAPDAPAPEPWYETPGQPLPPGFHPRPPAASAPAAPAEGPPAGRPVSPAAGTPPPAATSTGTGTFTPDLPRAPWEPPLTGPPRAPVPPQPRPRSGPTGPTAPTGTPEPRDTAPAVEAQAAQPAQPDYVGDGPPTYEAEPTALPGADPDGLEDLVSDTVLDGARYGVFTLRAASVRGDSARYRGEPRRDALLTARFGSGDDALVLVAMATGSRTAPQAHRAAADACQWLGRAVGRSHARLAEDIRAARRGDLKAGLHRLTDRTLGRLRARAVELGLEPEEYAAGLRCLLLPADPQCRTRVFFGVGAGGLFRLRDGEWQDIEPQVSDAVGAAVVGFGGQVPHGPAGDQLTMNLGITTPPSPYEPAREPVREPFRFRASVARPGDTLLLAGAGLAEPLRGEPAFTERLKGRWDGNGPPGLAAFLADVQVRVKGYADDRSAAAVWEA